MAAVTHRVATGSTSNVSAYTTGSFTPAVNDLLVAMVAMSGNVNSVTMSDSASGTWTLVATALKNTSTDLLHMFVRDTLIASAVGTTVTATLSSGTGTGAVVTVASVSSMTRTGSSAIKQSDTRANQAIATTPFTTFAANCLTGNPTFTFVGNEANPAGLTQPTSWTSNGNSGHNTPTKGSIYASRDSGFTSTTITWGSASGTLWGSIGLELDTSAAGGTITPDVGALTLAGFAPVLNAQFTPGAGTLALAGFAPVLNTQITPGAGGLTLAGFAPSLVNVTQITPGAGGLTLAGFAPVLNTQLTPGAGALALAGFAPVLNTQLTPGAGQITLAGFAPGLTTQMTPGAGQLTLAGFAPSLQTVLQLITGTGVLALAGFEPTLVVVQGAPAPPGGGIRPAWVYQEEARRKPRRKRKPDEEEITEAEPLPGLPELPGTFTTRTAPLTGLPLPGRRAAPPQIDFEDEEEEILFLMQLLAEA